MLLCRIVLQYSFARDVLHVIKIRAVAIYQSRNFSALGFHLSVGECRESDL